MSEPSQGALDVIASQIYWDLEHGDNAAARKKLVDLIKNSGSFGGFENDLRHDQVRRLEEERDQLNLAFNESERLLTESRAQTEAAYRELASVRACFAEASQSAGPTSVHVDALKAEIERLKTALAGAVANVKFTQTSADQYRGERDAWENVSNEFEAKMKERNEWGKGWKTTAESMERKADEFEEKARRIQAELEHSTAFTTLEAQRLMKELEKLKGLLDYAWTIIANKSGGDWTKESADWQEAAAKWRDEYHATR